MKFFEKMKDKDITDRWISILAGGLCAITVVYLFTIWNLNFHSDMAGANILAREQIRTGQWLPETWNTSTGLFIIFYNILMIPLSMFTENQILLRNLAVLIYLCTFIILLRHLSKKYLKSNCYLIFLCFFFSNTSPIMRDMAFIEAAYLPGLLDSIILLFLMSKAFDDRFVVKNRRCFLYLLLYIAYLSLYGTLNMAYQVLPLLGAIVLYILLENWEKSYDLLKSEIQIWLKAISAIFSSIIIGLIGHKLLVVYTGFQTGTNITYPESSNLANKFVEFILAAIGYRTNVSLFSLEGLMNAVVLFGFIAVVTCCVLLFIRYQEQPFPVKILMHFGLVVNALHLYLIFTHYCLNVAEMRYFFRPMMFLWLLAAYYIYTYVLSKGFLMKTLAVAAITIFSVPYVLPGLVHIVRYPENRENQLGLVNFLREQDLKHGYATFWNAGKNMVLSDFEIEIGGVQLADSIKPYYWLSSDATYDSDVYEGESFLLLTGPENEQYKNSTGMQLLGNPKTVLTYDNYVIYVYPYNIAKNEFCGLGFSNTEILQDLCVSDTAMRNEDGTLTLVSGQVIYGPYMKLLTGKYEIRVEFSELDGPLSLALTSDSGVKIWQTETLQEKVQTIYFETAEDLSQFEFVFTTDEYAVLSSLKINQVG